MASVAPSIDCSKSGEETACLAASNALSSPIPIPIPMIARPEPSIIALTSAKSKFTSPGTAIKSDIPCTPCLKTSSAILNASTIDVFLSIICNNLSFGVTTNVSTFPFKLSIPRSA